MLVALSAALLAGIYYVFISRKLKGNTVIEVIYVVVSVSLAYTIIVSARKIFRNEPVLTLSEFDILINDKREPVSILWQQVIDWKIEKDENTHYLVIETPEKRRKINISWLERKPAEIEALITEYKK